MALTKQDLKIQYGNDIIFPFKKDTIFTENKEGKPLGLLLANKEGKILCFECNKYFEQITAQHLWTHNMSIAEYRNKYSLSPSIGLCSKNRSYQCRLNALKNNNLSEKGKKYRISNISGKGRKLYHKGNGFSTIQIKNKYNTCPAQYEKRIQMVFNKIGKRNPGFKECAKIDNGACSWARNIGWKSWNEVKRYFGYDVHTFSGNFKKESDLIYDLRKYIQNFHSLPWKTALNKSHERLNNYPHSMLPYIKRFGSLRKAWISSGIKRIGYKYWEVID